MHANAEELLANSEVLVMLRLYIKALLRSCIQGIKDLY
jgi:hypothetical protein